MLQIFTNELAGQALMNWVHLAAPAEDEIQYVQEHYHIPPDFIRAALDKGERARIELQPDMALLIVQAPLRMPGKDQFLYRTVPIGIARTAEGLVTICQTPHPVFEEQIRGRSSHAVIPDLFVWVQMIARHYLRAVDELDRQIAAAEKRLQRSIHNKDVYTLLHLNKSLVYFTKSLKSNQAALRKLMKALGPVMNEQNEKRMQYALIELQQACDTAFIHNENLGNLMDAYAAVIETNVSQAVKTMTAAAFIITIPTVAATLYGMNTPLPFQDKGLAFAVLMGVSLAISGVTGWILYRKRLF